MQIGGIRRHGDHGRKGAESGDTQNRLLFDKSTDSWKHGIPPYSSYHNMTATFYAEAQKFVLVCNSATVYHIFRFSQAENRRTDIRAAVILKGDAIRRGRISCGRSPELPM
jgi:hypothetical protein